MRKYKIVMVENDPDERMFMKEGFEAAGLFEIMEQVKNGDALMPWLEEHVHALPDLILTDLNMPGRNGYDIIDSVRNDERFAHIPVVITSTSSARNIMDKCLAAGAADYIVKPDTFIEYEPFARLLFERISEKGLLPKPTA